MKFCNMIKPLSLTAVIFCGLPANHGSAAVQEPLARALSERAAADGFALSGIDQVGNETVGVSATDHSVTALRKLLSGYNYILELDPRSDTGERRPIRLRILGRAGDNPGEAASAAQVANASSVVETGAVMSNAGQTSGEPTTHPVARMLQAVAATTIPQSNAANNQALGVMGGASQGTASQSATASVSDPAHNAADMATLTQAASANVSALVAGLKAACPAGSKC